MAETAAWLNFHTVALLCLSLALGAGVFFTFAATPVLFRRLGREQAGDVVGLLFPGYFRLLAGLNAVAALLLYYRAEGLALGLLALAFLFQDLVLRPAIERHRPGRRAGELAATRAFRRLHAASAVLNLVALAAMTGLFFLLAV